jgi:Cu2+-exporting ATPase
LPVGLGGEGDFCCPGCAAVYALLRGEGLGRYYELRGSRGVPISDTRSRRRDAKWLELIEERVRGSSDHARINLDVQGLHCVGCVWLIDELFARAGASTEALPTQPQRRIEVNPALGRVTLVVPPDFPLRDFVVSVERFGYLFGPPIKRVPGASRDLLWRMGVCAAIAMNSMIFAIPLYAGLQAGPIFKLFTTLNFALAALAVAVGGAVFFRSAWQALRHRVLHLDMPIALGIALAFAGSAHSYFTYGSRAAYFDTIDIFITLMLLGRWLQERAIERNRAWLLASDGTEGLLARRVREGRVEIVRCAEIASGDALLVAPGDLVPVDARLEGAQATFSLDWILGESRPREYQVGDVVPAGAFAAGEVAAVLQATTAFAESSLRDLLQTPERKDQGTARTSAWFQRLSRIYVVAVLLVASAGFTAWWFFTRDLGRAMSVTTAVLIVTCPCAFGIAAPLAYEIVQGSLRRAGLFVRRASFLDRAREVRRVVFDKTGTLTTGGLGLANPETLDALTFAQRGALYDLVARSGHPKSAAVRDALHRHGVTLDPEARVREQAGRGLELIRDGKRYRIGEPTWVAEGATPHTHTEGADLAFGVDGTVLSELITTERLRPDAAREVGALQDDGYEVWLLSGDAQARVELAGGASGIDPQRCVGAQTPQSKARFLDQHDHRDTLFVGDGVNDSLALDHAYVSGTPAVDRPYVPARADFFFVTPGLSPVRLALRSSRVLAQVVRFDLAIALVYNAFAIGLALAGRMSPLLCAVLMPVSSLTTIAATVAALSPRSRLWRS